MLSCSDIAVLRVRGKQLIDARLAEVELPCDLAHGQAGGAGDAGGVTLEGCRLMAGVPGQDTTEMGAMKLAPHLGLEP